MEKISMTSPDESTKDLTKPFVEHLDDLRKTILWCAVSLLIGMCIAVPLAPWIKHALEIPVMKAGKNPAEYLKILKVAGGLHLALKLIFWSGLLFSAPFIVFAIGSFVFPGLTDRERKAIQRSSGFAVALFVAGVSMGYFVTLPVALQVMFKINAWLGETSEFVELGDYVAFVLKLLIAFGLMFQLPVILLALGSVGIISSQQLREKRRHVIVGLLVVAMLLTPPDPLTQLLMAGPMVILYEACIWMIWLKERRNADEEPEEPEVPEEPED